MRFAVYDTETSGIDTRYDQIVQIAALLVDEELTVLDSFEQRCRLNQETLPSPGALITHGISYSEIQRESYSMTEMMADVIRQIGKWGPACFAGYNSFRFDEEMLRHNLYRSLFPSYLTQTNGNTRIDAFKLVQVVAALVDGALVVPSGQRGRKTLRLDHLAAANGFCGHRVHDAMGDVEVTVYVMNLIRERAPAIWDMIPTWTDKRMIAELIAGNSVFVEASWYGKPCIKQMTGICQNPDVTSEWAVFDLTHDPKPYFQMSSEQLLAELSKRGKPKAIRRLKTNGGPTVFPADHPLVIDLMLAERTMARSRARQVQGDTDFCTKVQEALIWYRRSFPEPEHVEEQLYTGFPSPADQELMELFHSVPWSERPRVLDKIGDDRYRQLGRRIVFNDDPGTLSPDCWQMMSAAVRNRLTSKGDVPWMTVDKALAEIDSLRAIGKGDTARVLDDYAAQLNALKAVPLAAE